jgi:probable F420-dependent oxidoreductase
MRYDSRMRLGISLVPVSPGRDGDVVARVAREVERLGFDSVLASGKVLADPNGAGLDPVVTLAAVAGATERLRIITSVVVLPLYEPVVLANQASTLDVLSRGRFTLGVGVGWNEEEFDAVSVPFAERGVRADEHLEVMQALWRDRPATLDGRFTSFSDASLGVTPFTAGGPPIWVGGDSDGALRRALRFAEAWHGVAPSPDKLAEIGERLAPLGEEVGRNPATLERNGVYWLTPPVCDDNGFVMGDPLGGRTPTGESVADDLGRLGEAGISHVNVLLPIANDDVLDAIGWVAQEVLPKLDG